MFDFADKFCKSCNFSGAATFFISVGGRGYNVKLFTLSQALPCMVTLRKEFFWRAVDES